MDALRQPNPHLNRLQRLRVEEAAPRKPDKINARRVEDFVAHRWNSAGTLITTRLGTATTALGVADSAPQHAARQS